VDYENPNSNPEKIEAIVYKRMYNTLRNEIDQMVGKKKSPNKRIRVDSDSNFLANELETISGEKNLEITANYNTVKTSNHKTQLPSKKKSKFGSLDDKFIHKEYRHPGTFVIYNH